MRGRARTPGRAAFTALAFALCLSRPASTRGGESQPSLSVLPWNGAPAALSLTFDDGDESHLATAIPLLDAKGWKATFFIISDKVDRKEEWRQAFLNGHELGNHSRTHLHANELNKSAEKDQTEGAHFNLTRDFGVPVFVYAYPFCEESSGLKAGVAKSHLSARGCPKGHDYLQATDNPDWLDLPCHATKTADTPEVYKGWLDEALSHQAWTLLMIHGLEGTRWGWEPISKKNYEALLSFAEKGGFWVAPMGTVTAYWQAQKVLEALSPSTSHGVTKWTWKKPKNFPKKVVLKVKAAEPGGTWVAGSKTRIEPDKDGVLSVPFDEENLTHTPANL